ncbi:MAG: polysaccharide pyruvyl transferase family protein [Lachnospiraceae bacterium]|nr:polysaccharide pyruvyl transferase family protein [Candidatus Merdinaster equi]
MKKYLIAGANFNNKGAEAMMFACIDAIKKEDPQNEVYILLHKKTDVPINAKVVNDFIPSKLYACGGFLRFVGRVMGILKKHDFPLRELSDCMDDIDCVIDVSGYNLSSDWPFMALISYLSVVIAAIKKNCKVYLFPQSFGPFKYKGISKYIDRLSRKYLPRVSQIYVREADGEKHLEEAYHLTNVTRIADMVLQHKSFNEERIFSAKVNKEQIPELDKAVDIIGLVPNKKLFEKCDKEVVLELYSRMIGKINEDGGKVLIIPHTVQDMKLGKEIIEQNKTANVEIIEKVFYAYQYEEIFKQCKYVIASRYHSVIHTFKALKPCVILGWAIKYRELSELFDQENYAFDVREEAFGEKAMKALDYLRENADKESAKIEKAYASIGEDMCFGQVFEALRLNHM